MLLVCICVNISFSIFYDPSMLTNSGFGSDSLRVASSRQFEHFRFWSYAFSAHPAGLRSTHCVFLRSLLVGVFLVVSRSTHSCTHTLLLTAPLHIVVSILAHSRNVIISRLPLIHFHHFCTSLATFLGHLGQKKTKQNTHKDIGSW